MTLNLFPTQRFRAAGPARVHALVLAAAVLLPGAVPRGVEGQRAPDFAQEWRWVDFAPALLPPGSVEQMVESGGVRWIRTPTALAFFDGFEWITLDSLRGYPAGSAATSSLAVDGEGGVVVVVGGFVLQGDSAGLRVRLAPQDHPGWTVVRALPVGSGDLIVTARRGDAASGRAFLLDGASLREVPTSAGISGGGAHAWATRSGRAWAHTYRGLVVWREGAWEAVEDLPDGYRQVTFLTENAGGQGFAYRSEPFAEAGLLGWGDFSRPFPVTSEGKLPLLCGDVWEDGSALMIWASGHVRRLEEGLWRTIQLPTSRTQSLYFAHAGPDGDLWLASGRGLHWFRGDGFGRWRAWYTDFPDPLNRVNALVAMPDGSVWAGSEGGVAHYASSRYERFPVLGGYRAPVITGMAADSSGGIWAVSGLSFPGAFRWDGTGWTHWTADRGLAAGTVHAVHVDRAGGVWFLANGAGARGGAGVFRLHEGTVTRWLDPDGFLAGPVYAFAEGPDGALWFGGSRGLSRHREGVWTHWGAAEGIGQGGNERVFHVAVGENGVPWFTHGPGSEAGLGVLEGDATVRYLGPEDGLPAAELLAVAYDSEGALWVTSGRGVAFRHASGGYWTVLNEEAGLDSPSVWPVAFTRDHMLFGTAGGGVRALSREERRNPPPRVQLSQPLVEGESLFFMWRVHPFRGEILPGRALTRYRIDDGPWTPWTTRHSAEITGLRPGLHGIEVQARGLFGQVAPESAAASFAVPAPLHRQPAFVVPVGLLVVLLAAGLTAYGVRRRRHQRELRESEDRLRTLVEMAPEAIGLFDPVAGRFVEANARALRLFGVARERITQVDPDTLSPPRQPDGRPSREAMAELIAEAVAGGAPVRGWVVRGVDGREIPCELRLVALPSSERPLIRFSLVDVSERVEAEARRRDLEARLQQSQKLEAVGQLTGGVAHDFNNLLTVAMGNLDLLREDLDPSSPHLVSVDGAMQAVERGALLTRRLLAFSRRQILEPRLLQVDELIQGLLHLLRRTLGETVTVETVTPGGLWAVMADAAQLESALLNLAINARDAMPRGGRLVIEVANTTVDAEFADSELAQGDYVVVAVSDTGTGMSPEVAARAFDPFFTTKEVGKGSGLGLSMVYGFTRQSGGATRIYSEEGVGTTVRMYFPRSVGHGAGDGLAEPDEVVQEGRGETVLVVEDDPEVRRTTVSVLRRLGYATVDVGDGREALSTLRSRGADIDLLFTDVVLPGGMSGVEVAREARRLRPDLPVLFTSGYAAEVIFREGRLDPGLDLISKPFDRKALSRRIRDALAGRPRS